jgi:predicted Holliday junction resolvase-like endonuclease
MELLLISVLVIAMATAIWLAIHHAAYKAEHPYTKADIEGARKKSVSQSRATTLGKTAEQLAPLHPELFEKYSPSDFRFLGAAPFDFLVLDGLCKGDGVDVEIVFVEVKTGKTARLNANEKRVRAAVEAKRVSYEVFPMLGAADVSATPALEAAERRALSA